MHTERRTQPITLAVVHVNVGPENVNGAAQLQSYLNSISAGYNQVHDNLHTLVTAADNLVVWGAPFVNDYAIHHCIIGQASQSAAEWNDAYSNGELTLCAKAIAVDCVKYGLLARRLSVPEVHAHTKGMCGHIDVTNAFKADGLRLNPPQHLDHWDPGPYFPWDKFMKLVNFYIGNKPDDRPVSEEELMAGLVAGSHRVDPKSGKERFARLYPGKENALLLFNNQRVAGDTGPTPLGNWVLFGHTNGKALGVELSKDESEYHVFFDDSGVFKYKILS